ncbi:hypothetical protein O6H91_13G031000 [Diphasiastrum complanatum]|uniref:Uncharacterized protein n=1 Tax=Diphasiastrum complanatum TaxID=34168 RepID=A0ACC2BTD8_DIPCM|nr:hypothetical protein O6H91_13G031000 [Diphasiastrum complanatum]
MSLHLQNVCPHCHSYTHSLHVALPTTICFQSSMSQPHVLMERGEDSIAYPTGKQSSRCSYTSQSPATKRDYAIHEDPHGKEKERAAVHNFLENKSSSYSTSLSNSEGSTSYSFNLLQTIMIHSHLESFILFE